MYLYIQYSTSLLDPRSSSINCFSQFKLQSILASYLWSPVPPSQTSPPRLLHEYSLPIRLLSHVQLPLQLVSLLLSVIVGKLLCSTSFITSFNAPPRRRRLCPILPSSPSPGDFRLMARPLNINIPPLSLNLLILAN